LEHPAANLDPSFVVVLIWQFTQAWNDFLFSVVLTSPQNWTVTVALNNISGGQIVPWNLQMAGSLLAALPTLLVYIFLGRYFLRGMMAGIFEGISPCGLNQPGAINPWLTLFFSFFRK